MISNNVVTRECSRLIVKTKVLEGVDQSNPDHQLAFQENIEGLFGADVFSVRGSMSVGLQLTLDAEVVIFGIIHRSPSILLVRVEGPVVHIEKDFGLCRPNNLAEPRRYFEKLYRVGDLYHRVDIARISTNEVVFAQRTYSAVAVKDDPVKMWGPAHNYQISRIILKREEHQIRSKA